METATSSLLKVVGLAFSCVVIGIALLAWIRSSSLGTRALRLVGWLLIAFGTGMTALIAALQLTGRFGPSQLWFRAPSFFVAAAVLFGVGTWWFRRRFVHEHGQLIRYGLPAMVLLSAGVLVFIERMDGRSAPIAAMLPTMNSEAPEISFQESGGGMKRLSDYRGQVVLVNFWATWCTPCRREMPMLSAAQSEFRKDGLVVVYLSLEDPDVLADFLSTNHFEGVQGRLEKADDYYHAGQIYPLSYLISRDGHVSKRWSGRPSETFLQDSIRELL